MSKTQKIELSKIYKTRDGREARLYAIDETLGEYPVVGVHRSRDDNEWCVNRWTITGSENLPILNSDYDLIEVKPKRFAYINVYPTSKPTLYAARSEADHRAADGRVGCIRVELEEGRFDD